MNYLLLPGIVEGLILATLDLQLNQLYLFMVIQNSIHAPQQVLNQMEHYAVLEVDQSVSLIYYS